MILTLTVRTGKTVTVVEAIKQIQKKETTCHILACAPSNSASDLLCKKILDHVDEHSVFRMYASSRDPKMVPEELKVSAASFYAKSNYTTVQPSHTQEKPRRCCRLCLEIWALFQTRSATKLVKSNHRKIPPN